MSSMDPNAYQSPPGAAAPQKKSKLWLGLGIGCGFVLLLCCGVGAFLFYTAKSAFDIQQDPAVAQAVGQKIATVDIPNDVFQPTASLDMKVPFSGQRIMTMAIYEEANKQGTLILAEFPGDLTSADPEVFKLQIQQSMQQQGQGQQQFKEQASRDIEVTIRGEPAKFVLKTGTNEQGQESVQVSGVFKGNDGIAMLMFQAPTDKLSEEDAEAIVNSIE